jgi:serine protease Do
MYNEFQNENNQTYHTTIDSEVVAEQEIGGDKEPNQPRKGKGFLKLTVYAAVFGLIGGISFQGYNYATDRFRAPSNKVIEGSLEKTIDNTSLVNKENDDEVDAVKTSNSVTETGDVATVVENAMPSIVSITSTTSQNEMDIFGQVHENQATGSGSGIIIGQNKNEVLVATNNHVVEGATKVEVTFADEKVASATVKGTDSSADLAVVSVKLSDLAEDTKNKIKIATLGDSDAVKVGEMAIAIGNALGYGQSVTVGYISAKDRTVAVEDSSMKLLQTDAAINPGNSGGALLNSKGAVIGINSVKYASEEVEGMGYAIPISKAVPIINDLMNREEIPESQQAFLGIVGQDVTAEYAQRFNMPIGVYIGQVSDHSPAQKAGLVVGNIITGFNGNEIATMEELQNKLSYTKAGEVAKFTIKVLEKGQYIEKEVSVTLGSKADAAAFEQGTNK